MVCGRPKPRYSGQMESWVLCFLAVKMKGEVQEIGSGERGAG